MAPAHGRVARVAVGGCVLLPAVLTGILAFRSGGYFPGVTALVAAETVVVLALWFVGARRPFARWSPALLIAAGLLVAFGGWILVSASWSAAPWRVQAEWSRVVLYVAVLLLAGSVAGSVRRTRWLVWGMASALAAICVAAVVARTLPGILHDVQEVHPDRLAYPLSYWNALGIAAAIGIVLCGHLACEVRGPRAPRLLGAAAVPVLVAALYYTFSRGATWAALAGVTLYVLVARPRGLLSAALATVPTTLVVLLTINPADALVDDPGSATALAAGERVAIVLAVCALAAALLRLLCLPLDRAVARVRLGRGARRYALGICACAVVTAGAGAAVLGAPDAARAKYEEFVNVDSLPGGGFTRLLSASNNGRLGHWDAALEAYRLDRWRGSGAGTYEATWAREREVGFVVRDAHSLYLETLSELGIVGLVLLVAVLLLVIGALALRARGEHRAVYAALFAAATAWALHAGVDWDWEMPAVTLWLFAAGGAALARTERTAPQRARALGVAGRVVAVAACAALAIVPVRIALAEAHQRTAQEALHAGDCERAQAEARRSWSRFARPEPLLVTAWCARGRDPAAMLAAMRAAVAADGTDWRLRYGLAIAQAENRQDGLPQAMVALRLSPRSPLARSGVDLLGARDARTVLDRARSAPLPLP